MNRPFVFCHMQTAVDGRILGSWFRTPEGQTASQEFYNIAFGSNPYYRHQGWLSGRVTTDDNFTFYKEPQLDLDAAPVPEGDFVAKKADMYYFSVDPSGKLGWEAATLHYGDTTAHVVEILTGKASNAYKAFLRKFGISYIMAGEDTLDCTLVLEKIITLFGVETLMLGGGGVLNWSFIQAGCCDELSIVVSATADGNSEKPSLFESRGLSGNNPIHLTLEHVERLRGDSLWLRYTLNR